MNQDALKKLTMKGSMVGKDAAENLDERDAKLLNNLEAQPMYVSNDLRKKVRRRDNKQKIEKVHKNRSLRSKRVDNRKKADTVLEKPFTDKKVKRYKNNKSKIDVKGVDTPRANRDKVLFSKDSKVSKQGEETLDKFDFYRPENRDKVSSLSTSKKKKIASKKSKQGSGNFLDSVGRDKPVEKSMVMDKSNDREDLY